MKNTTSSKSSKNVSTNRKQQQRVYDRVCRDDLLLKMLRKGVSPHVIRSIQAWLTNRKSWVTFEGAKFKKTILKQGVPRGSVLSPLLFLFYIDDLPWGSGEHNTLASLLTMQRSGHRIVNSTLQRRDYNRARMWRLHGARTGRCCTRPQSKSAASSRRTRMNQNGNQLSL